MTRRCYKNLYTLSHFLKFDFGAQYFKFYYGQSLVFLPLKTKIKINQNILTSSSIRYKYSNCDIWHLAIQIFQLIISSKNRSASNRFPVKEKIPCPREGNIIPPRNNKLQERVLTNNNIFWHLSPTRDGFQRMTSTLNYF